MSEEKKSVLWAPEARDQLRSIDRDTAVQILRAIDDYLTSGAADIKKLRPPRDQLHLRSAAIAASFTSSRCHQSAYWRVALGSEAYR